MGIYSKIYNNICSRGVNKKSLWEDKDRNNLHRHHVIPRHSGGADIESNVTYLSVREHIAAHWLLWKINRNPNDLRAMKMLGANLSTEYRRIIGTWCKDNKIGFFSDKNERNRRSWRQRGAKNQKVNQIGIHNPVNFAKNASIGGKAAMQSPNSSWRFWTTAEGRSIRGRMGAEAIKGRRVMYKPGDTTFRRVKPEFVNEFLKNGYVFGSPIPSWNKGK